MRKMVLGLGTVVGALLCSALHAEPHKDVAWDILDGLTTEVGPRLAGTEAEARARDWAVAKLKALGFKNVRSESYDMPTWVRGKEEGEITAPFPHKLALTALGKSGATPETGLTGQIVAFANVDALKAAPDSLVQGKIVFVTHQMRPTQDGSSYGYFGPVRRSAPNIAAKKGAAAIVIRSLGTDSHRAPHTGVTTWEDGVKPIPAAALSNPDADNLERVLARAKTPVTLHLLLTPRFVGLQKSGNVIAEVPGSDPSAGIVVIGGHLDSWDLGTGAIDDASGVAITTAAAKAMLDGKPPRRTIRVVWWGAEEVGIYGALAYFEAHKNDNHVFAAESDFGADRIWQMRLKLPEGAKAVGQRLSTSLAQFGIATGKEPAGDGADIGPIVGAGAWSVDLQQDGTRYFDLHHTPDDTIDKIDPVQLKQNVDAWTVMLQIVANAPESLAIEAKK